MYDRIGTFVNCGDGTRIDASFSELRKLELKNCQLSTGMSSYNEKTLELVKAARDKYDINITAVWAGYTGALEWNFYGGPKTIGIVPSDLRAERLKQLCAGADFAYALGVTDVITHCGFIPENPNDPDFIGTVDAIRELCNYIKPRGQYFLFETGQETPVTILRVIEEVGTGNLGVNLDTANLILYGKANPLDALDVFGKYVRNTHCKDGFYPTNGHELGREVAIGQGKVDFPRIVSRLINEFGYTGPFVIEREISGEQQKLDIIAARDFLQTLM